MLYLVLTVGIDTLLFENPVGLIEIEEGSRSDCDNQSMLVNGSRQLAHQGMNILTGLEILLTPLLILPML
mgnify:CR=1 FL=1